MPSEDAAKLMDRWISDPGFRDAFKLNPHATVRDAGLTLSADEQAALAAIDWTLTDAELSAHVSKMV